MTAQRARGAAVWLLAFALLAAGGHALYAAAELQRQLDLERAEEVVRAAIEDRLQQEGAAGLPAFLREMVDRGALGLRYVEVRAAGGVRVAEAGVHDALRVPMVSPEYAARLRGLLHQLGGRPGRFEIVRDGRTLAEVDYVVVAGQLPAVRDEALTALRRNGALMLLLGGLLLAPSLFSALRRRLSRPSLARRLELAPPVAVSPEDEERARLESRAAQALDRLSRGVVIVDRELRIRHINRVAEQLTGWRREDAVGRLVYSVFHPLADDEQPLTTPAEVALHEGGETPSIECRLRARDGEVRAVEVMAAVLRDADGVVDGAVMFFHDVSARTRAVEGLRREARVTRGVIDHLVEGVVTTDAAGVIRFANARALRMFGYGKDELQSATISKLMPVPFLNSPGISLRDYVPGAGRTTLPRVVGWRKDATTFPIELVVEPMRQDDDEGLVVVIRDISDRLRSDNLSLRLGRLLDNAAEEIFIFDAQSLYFTDVNRGARRNLGLSAEQLARMTPLSLSVGLDEDRFHDYLARLRSGEVERLSYRTAHRRADGSCYPVEVRLGFSREEEPPVFMAVATDISELEAVEARLAHRDSHDALTDLPNRRTLMLRLEQALVLAMRSATTLGLLFVDLDHYADVNQRHGHALGDEALALYARRLARLVGEGGLLARLSGDDFVALLPGVADDAALTALATRMLEVVAEPLTLHGVTLTLGASIGATLYHGLEDDPLAAEELLALAERGMFEAKQAGRGTLRFLAAGYAAGEAPRSIRQGGVA